jgi:hypothetical protein
VVTHFAGVAQAVMTTEDGGQSGDKSPLSSLTTTALTQGLRP